jgi:hypothetical protein
MIKGDEGIFKGIWAAVVVLSNFVRDGIQFFRSCFSSRTSLVAENLFLRKQLSFYQEHQIRPRRLRNSVRVALVFWSRFFEWRSSLLIVKPTTLIGWYRKAFSQSHSIPINAKPCLLFRLQQLFSLTKHCQM